MEIAILLLKDILSQQIEQRRKAETFSIPNNDAWQKVIEKAKETLDNAIQELSTAIVILEREQKLIETSEATANIPCVSKSVELVGEATLIVSVEDIKSGTITITKEVAEFLKTINGC